MKSKYLYYVIAVLPIIYFLVVSPEMSDQVIVHWNAAGEPDRYGSKYMYLFLSLIPALLIIFNELYIKYSKRTDNIKYQYKIINFLVVFFTALVFIFINTAIKEQFIFTTALLLLLSIMFMFIGNVLNKLERNRSFGIRLPATLRSDIVWRKTHYIGGYLFVAIGIITLLATLLLPDPLFAMYLMIGLLLACIIFLIIYSELIYRKLTK